MLTLLLLLLPLLPPLLVHTHTTITMPNTMTPTPPRIPTNTRDRLPIVVGVVGAGVVVSALDEVVVGTNSAEEGKGVLPTTAALLVVTTAAVVACRTGAEVLATAALVVTTCCRSGYSRDIQLEG